MSKRFPKAVGGEQQRDAAADASSSEPRMIADDAHGVDFRSTVTRDRRLRNLILLANVLAWIVIVVAIRWLFF